MLLFNPMENGRRKYVSYFNTSNVTIQHEGIRILRKVKKDFNTSNVTIQPALLIFSLLS